MKPIGKHIIIKTIDEEIVSKKGLILSADDTSKLRYRKGEVFAVGTGVDIIDNGDIIYYNKISGYTMLIEDEPYTVILEKDVVVVL